MKRALFALLALTQFMGPAFAQEDPEEKPAPEPTTVQGARSEPAEIAKASDENAGPVKFYVIRIEEAIAQTTLFAVRRGVKDAEAAGAKWVVLDIETPGGQLGVTLEIMEVLEKFNGQTIAYVNREAISAGAFISAACDAIYFAPGGVIGAAAPVTGEGEDIQKTMKQKIVSYLSAKVRAISEENPLRGQVITAMMDEDYELKVGETVIKAKGSLLSLTATEAMKEYGDPPQPLLGAGVHDDVDTLCRVLAGSDSIAIQQFEVTWSLGLARWLTAISPLLLGIAGLCMLIEFKTQGFTGLGVVGMFLFLVVLFGHNIAGLSDHTAMLVFVVGTALVFIELFFFPGTVVIALLGAVLMVGSLLWGMADIWPNQPSGFSLDPAVFMRPLANLFIGMAMTFAMAIALLRFLPKSWVWDRMVLQGAVQGVSGSPHSSIDATAHAAGGTLIGAKGRAVSGLFPSGEVEVNGQRVQARLDVGSAPVGTTVRIVRRADFVYIVEVVG